MLNIALPTISPSPNNHSSVSQSSMSVCFYLSCFRILAMMLCNKSLAFSILVVTLLLFFTSSTSLSSSHGDSHLQLLQIAPTSGSSSLLVFYFRSCNYNASVYFFNGKLQCHQLSLFFFLCLAFTICNLTKRDYLDSKFFF